ncbi:GTPase [Novosphingobium sediminis]|nr:GTPase [Novosphingobium sediminis]
MSLSISEQLHATLEEAISEAVIKGREAADKLRTDIERVAEALNTARLRLNALDLETDAWAWAEKDSVTTAQQFETLCVQEYTRLKDVWNHRSQALGNFNIVLFGRTGTGKSTLMEALSHGNGQSVSPGQSDWTVDIRETRWQDCRIIDTPGIDGWGRVESRATLEETARCAVERADIVLLCFDTQSQQVSEFEKVSQWVKEFGKPAVVALNVRDTMWRLPPRCPDRHNRAKRSKTVADHIERIRGELVHLALCKVPLVALNTKRALRARASVPFADSLADEIENERTRYGIARLLSWSNLPALEALLSEALTHDAPQIRLGMLRRSLRGDLARIAALTADQHQAARKAATRHDAKIAALLAYVGYPKRGTTWRAGLGVPGRDNDLLAMLETLRGAAFDTPEEGELDQQITTLVEATLGPERAKSLRQAEVLVLGAFAQGKEIDESAFSKSVFDTAAIESARQAVLERAYGQIGRRLAIAPEAKLNADAPTPAPVDVGGAAGWGWRWLSNTSRVGKMGAPLLALETLGTSLVATWVLHRVQATTSNWAEAARSTARREALAKARAEIDAHFDAIGDQLRQMIAHARDAALLDVLGPLLRKACLAYRIAIETAQDGDIPTAIASAQGNLGDQDSEGALAAAALRIEKQRYPDRRDAGRLIWAGEDWIDGEQTDQQQADTCVVQPLVPHTPWTLSTAPQMIGMGRTFAMLAEKRLREIEAARPVIAQLRELASLDRPTLVLAGDYNVGKTSLIRRLLAEAGKAIPDSLEVRADPTTLTAMTHDLDGFRIVDTPGFGSGRAEDDEMAADAMTDASASLWLVDGAVRDDTLDRLCANLSENRTSGRADRWAHTLLVIGRGDELFGDPRIDPVTYAERAAGKKREYVQALAERGINFPLSRMLVVAADPYGCGESDAHRDWDGITALCAAIEEAIVSQQGCGIDFAVVSGGVARLSALEQRLSQEQDGWQAQGKALALLCKRISTRLDEGAAMRKRIETEIGRMINETIDPLLDDFLKADSEAGTEAAAKKLESWPEDPVFVETLGHWEDRWKIEIDRWVSRARSEIDRSRANAEWKQAQIHAATGLKFGGLTPSDTSGANQAVDVSRSGIKQAAQMADKIFTRDNMYKVGKWAGVKFKPWGATKAAEKLAEGTKTVAKGAGAVLAVASALLEFRAYWSERAEAERRDQALADLIEALRKSGADVRASLLGDDETPRGAAAYLAAHLAEIGTLNNRYAPAVEMLEARAAHIAQQRDAIAATLDEGWNMLEMLMPKDTNDAR